MTAATDPTAITPAERIAELAALLARAYIRLLVRRRESQNALALSGQGEPSCAPVSGAETPGKERT